MKQAFIILTALTFLSLGCSKEKFATQPHGYYMMTYSNSAWGHQHNGWIIDTDGNVMSFDLPENWQGPDSLGYYFESVLENNVAQCDESIKKISLRTLYKYNKLIDGAAEGHLSEPQNTGADGGGLEYACFQYDKNKKRYKKVYLDVEGDWEYHNESQEAIKITEWMKKIK